MSKLEKMPLAVVSLRFLRDERGATAIEYAMIASGVAVTIAATLVTVGSSVTNLYSTVLTALK